MFSPIIGSIKVIRTGKVKRAKLYYLRERKGKSARISEKIKKNIGVDVSQQVNLNDKKEENLVGKEEKKEDINKEKITKEKDTLEKAKLEKKELKTEKK